MPQGKTKKAIHLTRKIMLSVLEEPGTMVLMCITTVRPEDVEDTVMEILKYLEKTEEKA